MPTGPTGSRMPRLQAAASRPGGENGMRFIGARNLASGDPNGKLQPVFSP